MSWEKFRSTLARFHGEARADLARQILAQNQRAFAEDPPDWLIAAAGMRALAERDELLLQEARPPARKARVDAAEIRRWFEEDKREGRVLALAIEGLREQIAESRRGYEERLAAEEAGFDRDFKERFGEALVISPPVDEAELERRAIAGRLGLTPSEVV